MRSSIGLSLVLALGGCATGTDDDDVNPRPVPPGPAESHEPLADVLDDNARPLLRSDTAAIPGDDVRMDTAYELGRRSRARYDRLVAAGFLR